MGWSQSAMTVRYPHATATIQQGFRVKWRNSSAPEPWRTACEETKASVRDATLRLYWYRKRRSQRW